MRNHARRPQHGQHSQLIRVARASAATITTNNRLPVSVVAGDADKLLDQAEIGSATAAARLVTQYPGRRTDIGEPRTDLTAPADSRSIPRWSVDSAMPQAYTSRRR